MANHTSAVSQASTWCQAIALWLLTNVFGLLAWLLGLFIAQRPLAGDVVLFSIAGALIVAYSFFEIPLVYLAFRWLLKLQCRPLRLAATLAVTVAFFALSTWLPYMYAGSYIWAVLGAGGWVYLPAALAAAATVYRKSLFRLNSCPNHAPAA